VRPIETGSAADLVDRHVAVPEDRPTERAFVRLNMISSADGATAIDGVSGGLGNSTDHQVFAGLRARADAVIVGIGTVVPEHYRPPERDGQQIYVVTSRPDISGDPELFASGRATLVLPEDAAPSPAGVPELRAGREGRVDLTALTRSLAGQVAMLEGGPSVAGEMLALGLVDEFFHTIAPYVLGGVSPRLAHGAVADSARWQVQHSFCDDDGYLFVRYAR
jgi:riboflavin biosynthesis pyrimidine reductase